VFKGRLVYLAKGAVSSRLAIPKTMDQILGQADRRHMGKETLPLHEAIAFPRKRLQIRSCHSVSCRYLARPMPKSIARSKTRKSVAKRFKVTASGKVLRSRASRRHLMSAKNAKKKRQLAKMGRVHETDLARIKTNLPFA